MVVNGGNGQGETYMAADVRKMPDGRLWCLCR